MAVLFERYIPRYDVQHMDKQVCNSELRMSTMGKKKRKWDNPSTEVMAQILGNMGIKMEIKKQNTDGNQLTKAGTTEKWDNNG